MLETIRVYALERLGERGDADAIGQQHATYFLKFAEQYDPWPRLHAPPLQHWLDRLEADHDNLRAALGWFAQQAEAERGVRLAGALAGFWADRFHWDEGRAWLEVALTRSGNMSAAARAKAVLGTAWLAARLGDVITAGAYVEEGLALFRELSDKAAIALALLLFGDIALGRGEYATARAYAEECLALFHEVSDPWGRALARRFLGSIATLQGDLAQAAILYEESLTSFRQIGDKRGIGESLVVKGVLAQLQGEWEQAVACYAESLAIFRELGAKEMIALDLHNLAGALLHQGDAQRAAACFAEGLALSRDIGFRYGIAMSLAGVAGVAAAHGHPERSARLFGAAEALFDAIGQAVEPGDRVEYDHNAAIARTQLGDRAFAAAWEAGRTMPLEQAIAEALELSTAAINTTDQPLAAPPTNLPTPPNGREDQRVFNRFSR
jgi:non-specific serine/threonine protein kinase